MFSGPVKPLREQLQEVGRRQAALSDTQGSTQCLTSEAASDLGVQGRSPLPQGLVVYWAGLGRSSPGQQLVAHTQLALPEHHRCPGSRQRTYQPAAGWREAAGAMQAQLTRPVVATLQTLWRCP